MPINSAEDLFSSEIRAIYSAEKQLTSVLPSLSQAAHADAVRQGLQERIRQGQDLLQRMDQLLDQMSLSKDHVRNEAVEGLIGDTRQLMDAIDVDSVRDSAVIGAVQKIEHYCIAAWGTAATLGRTLGRQPAVDTFEHALAEGKKFDKAMTELAEGRINPSASKAGPTAH